MTIQEGFNLNSNRCRRIKNKDDNINRLGFKIIKDTKLEVNVMSKLVKNKLNNQDSYLGSGI